MELYIAVSRDRKNRGPDGRQARIQAGALPARAPPPQKKEKRERGRGGEGGRGERKKGGNETFKKRKNVC